MRIRSGLLAVAVGLPIALVPTTAYATGPGVLAYAKYTTASGLAGR